MNEMQAGLTVLTALVVPYIVQAIKSKAMAGNVARWIAIAVSAGCGVLTAMSGGMPTDPSAWVTSIFACVGGVQVAYAAFKTVGVTDKWLDALLALGDIKED
jgi:acid phosphatase family membrane protein YuiD